MCDFPSWVKLGQTEQDQVKQVEQVKQDCLLWCTDKLLDEHGIDYVDGVGHHAIKKVWKVEGEHCEGFPCPSDLVKDIMNGRMKGMMEAGGYKGVMVNGEGELHSVDDLPAVIWVDGDKFWYKNGKLHRGGDQPAAIYVDGSEFWYKNGDAHRDGDQPAKIWADGDKEWYKNGEFIK